MTCSAAEKLRIPMLQKYVETYKRLNPCKCGEHRPVCLTFHHREPELKVANVSKLVRRGVQLPYLKAEIDKCDVMCHNCHTIEHSIQIPYKVTKILSFCGLTLMFKGTAHKLKIQYP
tara:strand:+ start:2109 stop:2459 length:351 start_codon:yes stop_codon:yes gene_type:complete